MIFKTWCIISEFAVGGQKFDRTFVIATTFTGEVYFWGKYFKFPSNNTIDIPKTYEPALMQSFPKTISTVACGHDHIIALSDTGKVIIIGFISKL